MEELSSLEESLQCAIEKCDIATFTQIWSSHRYEIINSKYFLAMLISIDLKNNLLSKSLFLGQVMDLMLPTELDFFLYQKRDLFLSRDRGDGRYFLPIEIIAVSSPKFFEILREKGLVSSHEGYQRSMEAMLFLDFAYQTSSLTRNDRLPSIMLGLMSKYANPNDNLFLRALQIIDDYKMDVFGEKVTRIKKLAYVGHHLILPILLPYRDHDAYIFIVCDLEEKPLYIVYCDSFCPKVREGDSGGQQYRFGAVSFRIDPAKSTTVTDLANVIPTSFYLREDFMWREALSNFVLCDGEGIDRKLSVPIKYEIPCKPQARDRFNCSFNSLCIAMRWLVQFEHPEMIYELSPSGVPYGDLRDAYKQFRRKAVFVAAVDMSNLAREIKASYIAGYEVTDYFKELSWRIVRDLELMHARSQRKSDAEMSFEIDKMIISMPTTGNPPNVATPPSSPKLTRRDDVSLKPITGHERKSCCAVM